jgi:hypothetical protein
MTSAMVKINPQTHAKLQEIARDQHRPMGEIVTELVERYEREQFWKGVTEDLERLRADPAAWKDYQDEIAVFEGGSMDGIEHEPPYFTPDEVEEIRARHPRAASR